MSNIKTKQHDGDVTAFIKSYANSEQKIEDSFKLIEIMEEVTGEKPSMWGDTMIGFGKYHYKSNRSAQEGDWFAVGFSPRKTAFSLYIYTGLPEHEYLLENLGKFKIGKACIYVKKLSDVNVDSLVKIMKTTLEYLDEKYGLIK